MVDTAKQVIVGDVIFKIEGVKQVVLTIRLVTHHG